MNNPWKNLVKTNGEYIADCDKEFIPCFKKKLQGDYALKLNVTPGPFTGDLKNAKVYLLNLNPGYENNDIKFTKLYGKDLIKNLSQKFDKYPFFDLNPLYKGTGGYSYWNNKLSHFIEDVGLETTAKKVSVIEYFPYHSYKYKKVNCILPSQEYSFSVIRKAMADKKIIILMRSVRIWYEAIPELEKYKNKYILNSPQNVKVSPKNLGSGDYKKIIAAL